MFSVLFLELPLMHRVCFAVAPPQGSLASRAAAASAVAAAIASGQVY
jgi:hypothetical protein